MTAWADPRRSPALRRVLLKARAGRPRPAEGIELAPAEDQAVPRVLHHPDETARIRGVAVEDTLPAVVAKLQPRTVHHDATVARVYDDAWVLDGDVYLGDRWMPVRGAPVAWRPTPEPEELDEAMLVSSRYGLRFFGHWMHDDLPRELIAEDLALPGLSVLTRPTPQQRAYGERLRLRSRAVDHARVHRLTVVDDAGQNAYRRARFRRLRERALGVDAPVRGPGVYMRRGSGGAARTLDNEDEVMALAERLGLRVLDPQSTPVHDFVTMGAGARLLVGIEGSHLANVLQWMRPGSALLLLHPPQHFNLTFKDVADALGVRTASHIGEATGPTAFRVDLARVAALAERLLSQDAPGDARD